MLRIQLKTRVCFIKTLEAINKKHSKKLNNLNHMRRGTNKVGSLGDFKRFDYQERIAVVVFGGL